MVKKTGQPGYLQIADDLRQQIRGGTLAPGTALPSTAQLAEHYDASLSVVKMAMGILRNEGLVIGQQDFALDKSAGGTVFGHSSVAQIAFV